MAMDSLAIPLVNVFESNITHARLILGAMGGLDLLKAFRLTQKLEDYIIDLIEQIESLREKPSSSASTMSSTLTGETRHSEVAVSSSLTVTNSSRHVAGLKRRGAAGSSSRANQSILRNFLIDTPVVCNNSQTIWNHKSEEVATFPLDHSPVASSLTEEPEPSSPASALTGRDYVSKPDPIVIIPSGSVFPSSYPYSCSCSEKELNLSPEPGETLLVVTPEPKRARSSLIQQSFTVNKDIWRVSVCLLPGPEFERSPSSEQITEWTLVGQGLPQNQDSVQIDRRWTLVQLAEFVAHLYPEFPQLSDVGYSFCFVDTDSKLEEVQCPNSLEQLSVAVGSGPLYIRPLVELYPTSFSTLPSLSSTPSKLQIKVKSELGDSFCSNTDSPEKPSECSLCSRTFLRVGDMRRHMREQHTSDCARTKLCHICKRAFKRSFHLNSHLMSMHGLVSGNVSLSANGRQVTGRAVDCDSFINNSRDDSLSSSFCSIAEDDEPVDQPQLSSAARCITLPGTGVMCIEEAAVERSLKQEVV